MVWRRGDSEEGFEADRPPPLAPRRRDHPAGRGPPRRPRGLGRGADEGRAEGQAAAGRGGPAREAEGRDLHVADLGLFALAVIGAIAGIAIGLDAHPR